MKYYVSGYIKEINAGFKVSLLEGGITGTFHSDEKALEFTTKNIKKFIEETGAFVAIKFIRIDGIKTYLMYSNDTSPFEMCEFDFIESHSGYFPKSRMRSVIDTHHVNFNNIARVSSSGTPKTSNVNWFRIFIDLILYAVLGGVALYYLKNPTLEMGVNETDNTKAIIIFTSIISLAAVTIGVIVSRKIYYGILVGKRGHRTNVDLKRISNKNWVLFRRVSKALDIIAFVLTVTQLILLIIGVSIIWNTIYFDDTWQSYLSKIIIFMDIIHCIWMSYFLARVLLRGKRLENSLLKIHILNKTKADYEAFLKGQIEDIPKFDSRNTHFILKVAPKKILDQVLNAEQKIGLEARHFKKERKRIFLEKLSRYDIDKNYFHN